MDNINPEDSTSQLFKTSTLLSHIFKEFYKELHNKTAECEKDLQKQREKLFA